MMEYVIRAFTRSPTRFKISDVTFDHPETGGSRESTPQNFVEICPVTGRKVVDADHGLTKRQQIFQQIGADEAGNTRHHPDFGRGRKGLPKLPVRCGDHELVFEVCPLDQRW